MRKPVIRCSQLPQLLRCHGSRVLGPLVPPLKGEQGYEGVYLHWMAAADLILNHGATKPEGGMPPPRVPRDYKPPKNSLWVIDWFVRRVCELIPAAWSLQVEVALEYEFERFILRGHPDVIGISPEGTAACIPDLKTGRIPTDLASFNDQLLGYLVLAAMVYGVDSVYTEIDQPFNSEDDGFPRQSHVEAKGSDLTACIAFLVEQVEEALDSEMEVESGMTQCRYCPAARHDVCPAIRDDYDFMKTTITPEFLAKIKEQPNDAVLGDIVMLGRTLKGPIERAEEMVKERLGGGFEVVALNGTRISMNIEGGRYEVKEPELMLAALLTLLPTPALAPAITYSTDRIKDAIASHYNRPKTGTSGNSADDIFKAKLGAFVEQGERRKLVFS